MEPALRLSGRIYEGIQHQGCREIPPERQWRWFGSMVNAGLLSDIRSHGTSGSMYLRWQLPAENRRPAHRCDDCLRLRERREGYWERQRRMKSVGYHGTETASRRSRRVLRDDGRDGDRTESDFHDLLYGFGVILKLQALFPEKRLRRLQMHMLPIHVVEEDSGIADESVAW